MGGKVTIEEALLSIRTIQRVLRVHKCIRNLFVSAVNTRQRCYSARLLRTLINCAKESV